MDDAILRRPIAHAESELIAPPPNVVRVARDLRAEPPARALDGVVALGAVALEHEPRIRAACEAIDDRPARNEPRGACENSRCAAAASCEPFILIRVSARIHSG